MNKKIVFLILVVLSIEIYSQDEIGYLISSDYQLIEGYFDMPFTSDNQFSFYHNLKNKFSNGYFINLGNEKELGLILNKFSPDNLKFKSDEDSEPLRIDVEECRGYVVGIDSFAVIQKFIRNSNGVSAFFTEGKEFIEVIDWFDSLVFYKHYILPSNSSLSTTVTFVVENKKSDSLVILTQYISNKFIESGLKIFGNFEFLANKIKTKEYKSTDILNLIKMLKYKSKLDKNEKIYFNYSWDEINDSNNCYYYAYVKSILNGIYKLNYYSKKGILLYTGSYSFFSPDKKSGEFIYYYPNGTKRKKILYKDNEIAGFIETYHPNGILHYEYKQEGDKIIYNRIITKDGEQVLDQSGNGKEKFYDIVFNRELIRDYSAYYLKASYFINDKGVKIYQYCDRNAKIKDFQFIKSKFSKGYVYPEESLNKYIHGYIIVSFLIDPEKNQLNIHVIKGLDKSIDASIVNYFFNLSAINKYWECARHDKKRVPQEIIMPVCLSIDGYTNSKNFFYPMFEQEFPVPRQLSPGYRPRSY